MNNYKEAYEFWKTNSFFDESTRAELEALTDEKEIEDRFYKELEFGTAGLRGIMGAGTNRMNRYNVRKSTSGFADYLLEKFGEDAKTRGIAIAYDVRNNSKEFALETALTMNAKGIPAYLYTMVSATPLLSYTVRELGCVGGVVITASHNMKEYNGYKAYDETGCQLYPDDADAVIAKVAATDITKTVVMDEAEARAKGLLKDVGEEMLRKFTDEVQKLANPMDPEAKKNIKVVYTPLHGAGIVPVSIVLEEQGYTQISPVPEQSVHDGNFPTVISPNPEEKTALNLAIEQAKREEADIVVATDPDSDRLGIAVRHDGDYVLFSGNQTGAVLLNYMLLRRAVSLPENPALVMSVVTGELGAEIARNYHLNVYETLTGFKFIGRVMTDLQKKHEANAVFGYEESYGYTAGDYVRDKDGVMAAMMVCEMAAFYKAQGLTLVDVLNRIYEEYGYHLDIVHYYVLQGKDGSEKIASIMEKLRADGLNIFGAASVKDFDRDDTGLVRSNVLKFRFDDGSWLAARPSGTEPKIKFYHCIKAPTKAESELIYNDRKAIIDKLVEA